METGCPFQNYQCKTTELADDERVLGFKARMQNEAAAYYLDF